MRIIDADALADNIAVLFERNKALIDEWLMHYVEDAIDEAPTIDAVPVRHGHWEFIGGYGYQYRCSNCVRCAEHRTNYCPSCGCKMDKETT